MPEYRVTVPDGANGFQYNGVDYGPGDKCHSDNACDVLGFANAFYAKNPQRGRQDETPNFWSNMSDACPAGPAAAPVAAPASAPNETDPRPDGGDTAQRQGAPNTAGPPAQGRDTSPPADEPPEQPQPGARHQTHGGEQSQRPTRGGDPVDLFRGAFVLEETDLQVPTATMSLAFVRRYRSGAPNRGPFGWNWDHNHNVFLREIATGDVTRWDGALHEDVFRAQGGGFDSPPGVFQVLERVAGQPQTYRILGDKGMVWLFERPAGWTDAERIPLAEIRDQHGNRLLYSYDARDRVAEVRDDDDRFLQFGYGECELLESVRDHAGREFQYWHEADVEHLACVRMPPTTEYPEGVARYYEYASRDPLPGLRHNIVRITDQDGRTYLENEFDPDPAAWTFARVTTQRYGDYVYQYRYTQLQWVPMDNAFVNIPSVQTEVMAPDFGVTTYTFNYRGDLLDHRLRLAKDRTWRVAAFTYDYDSQGNLISTIEPDGLQELRVYDDANPDPRLRGKLLRRELSARAGFPVPSRIVFRAEYEPAFGLVRRVFDENGAETRYRYDFDLAPGPGNTGKLREVVHSTATLPDGTPQPAVTRYETDARGNVTAVVAANGVRDEMEYGVAGNGRGRLVLKRRDSGGVAIEERLDYDAFGFLDAMTDGSRAVRRTVHNAIGQVERRISPTVGGATAEVVTHFDSDGKAVAVERPRGAYVDGVIGAATHIIDRIERNVLGHPIRLYLASNTAASRTIDQCVDFRGLAERVSDPVGTVHRFEFDERGLTLREWTEGADGTRAATRRVFDRSGRILRLLQGPAEDRVAAYRYDGFGRMAEIDHPNGSTSRFTWAARDLLASEEIEGDPGDGSRRLLARKRYEYDERARLIRSRESSFRTDPATAVELVEEYFFDEVNQLRRIVDGRGGVTVLDYDGAGRLTSGVDPEGNAQVYEYDAVSRMTAVTFQDREALMLRPRRWQMEYDARGRRTRGIEPDGTETREEFDDRDLPIRRVEPLNVVRERAFGAFGELQVDTLDPTGLNIVNRWEYDSRSRPVRYLDPTGETSTYTYDGLSRPVLTTFPGGLTSSRVFNAAGYLELETLAGVVDIHYGYDGAGRLASLRSAGAGAIAALADHTFAYDGRNNLVRATAGPFAVTRMLDSRGRLIRESVSGATLELLYNDLAGTRERRWPDGRIEVLATDLNGRVTSITRTAAGALGSGPAVLAALTSSGARHFGSATLAGVLTQSAVYDARKRLTDLTYVAGGATVARAAYAYDARSRRRVESLSPAPGQLRHYQYDARDRLVNAADGFAAAFAPSDTQAQQDAAIAVVAAAALAATRELRYDHDAADDRTRLRQTGAPDVLYTYGPCHRMTSDGATALTYTTVGTRTTEGTRAYDTDALGRVVRCTDGAATLFEIAYDALGRPARLIEGGTSRTFHYLGDELWQESTGGAPVRQFTPHPALAGSLAMHVAGATLLTAYDGRMNLAAAFDVGGNPVELYRYDPFGGPAVFTGAGAPLASTAVGAGPAFGGMYYITSAGLYLSRRRLMDPAHGVFLSVDPYAYADSPSLYVYAAQDPINLIDPTGEFAFLAILAVMAVGTVVAGGINAARQGIQMAEGSRTEFSWGELGLSAGIGAVVAPILVVAPEVAVPLAAYGVANGFHEMSQGHYATGTFDIVTSLAPFGFKGPKAATLGEGTRFGQMRGLGESASWSTRFGRFNQLDAAIRTTASDAWNRRFYRGTTYYEALITENNNMMDLNVVIGRQYTAEAKPGLGPGLYFTETMEPPAPGSAGYWAEFHGGSNRVLGSKLTGGGPAVLEARIPRLHWRWLSRQEGIEYNAPQARFPPAPSNLETFVPEALAHWFNERATWRVMPETPAPSANFSPLWPTLLTPSFRTPGFSTPGGDGSAGSPSVGTTGASTLGTSGKK